MRALLAYAARGMLALAVAGCASFALAKRHEPAAMPPVNPEFTARVGEYVALRRRVQASLPAQAPTADAAEIVTRQRALADAIRGARPGARQGDIFTPAVADDIRRTFAADLASRPPPDAAAALRQSPALPLEVNATYPDSASLAAVPPLLLRHLPRLPEDPPLEFRLVGRSLILLDADARLIVDFIPDALPARTAGD